MEGQQSFQGGLDGEWCPVGRVPCKGDALSCWAAPALSILPLTEGVVISPREVEGSNRKGAPETKLCGPTDQRCWMRNILEKEDDYDQDLEGPLSPRVAIARPS